MNFIAYARSNSHILTKISWYVVALEALYISGKEGDISYRLRCRVPLYLGGTSIEKENIYQFLKQAYSIRSSYLHGDNIPKNLLKEEKKTIEISITLDDLLRRTILKILKNENNDQEIFFDSDKKESFFHNLILGNLDY